MARKYKNPPIVEALCEFQFLPSQTWDMTIPGLFYEKVKNDFPVKQQQTNFGIAFQPKEDGIVEQKVETSQRMQFFRSDKSALVQISTDFLSINHLKPYPTWDSFKPIILKNLNLYIDIGKPKGFKRIGVRYINKIDISLGTLEINDYFNYYPFIPKTLPQSHGAFQTRIEIPYQDQRDILILNLASAVPEKPETISIILDLDYISRVAGEISFDQANEWIEHAHNVIESVFESCITEKCRGIFEEVK